MAWRADVKADNGEWEPAKIAFPTRVAAIYWVLDVLVRWGMVLEVRIVEC